jgi:general secretion pathway protein H
VAKATTRTSHPGKPDAGFSLLELILVLLLLAAAATVVVPSFVQGLARFQLETATRDLATNLRQARTRAVATQRVYRVLLQPAEVSGEPSAYTVTDEYEHPLKTFLLPEPVSFAGVGEAGWNPVISFYPNGRCSRGTIVLAAGNRRLSIVLNPITGFGSLVRPGQDSR